MELPANWDWKNPDYEELAHRRMRLLNSLREADRHRRIHEPSSNLGVFEELKLHYRERPWNLINDWGVTIDPRLVDKGLPALVPFMLFPKQQDFCMWVIEHWKAGTPGLGEKSRDCGVSWTAMALACTLGLLYDGFSAGFGSRKEEYVDKIGQPKALFPKARVFLQNLPPELRGGWDRRVHSPHMRINFPETGSIIAGEAGDQIGRGDRTSIYFVDEAAYLERPEQIEASLSQTTNCRIDFSSVRGMNNPFAQKRHGGKIDVFVFDWRDDPRKDQAWYEKQREELDPVTLAQEVDRDYTASVEGIVIPGLWVQAAIDAHLKLNLEPTGERSLALDIADGGKDLNAAVGAHGFLIDLAEEWTGRDSDTFYTAERAFQIAHEGGYRRIRYDSDGLGAYFRGDARVINERRENQQQPRIIVDAFRGSAGVHNPESQDVKGRLNKDYFANLKAQGWWSLRTRFQKTYRWVVEGKPCRPDEIIAISSKCKNFAKLVTELSQPTSKLNGVGKVLIDKSPDGMKSPNLGDGAMIRFAPGPRQIEITPEIVRKSAVMGGGRRHQGPFNIPPAPPRRRFP